MAERSLLRYKNRIGSNKERGPLVDVLEFEVNGKTIEFMSVPLIERYQYIDWFYERYGTDGQAYLIKPSKLNVDIEKYCNDDRT